MLRLKLEGEIKSILPLVGFIKSGTFLRLDRTGLIREKEEDSNTSDCL